MREKAVISVGQVNKPHVGVADAEKVNGVTILLKVSKFLGIAGSKVGANDKDTHGENEEEDAQGSYLARVNLGFFQRDIHKECREDVATNRDGDDKVGKTK
jgi:hypothetical protein